ADCNSLSPSSQHRLETFNNFPPGCPVSVTTLAQAGFCYTGVKDRVTCFSCKESIENWESGDSPIGRHRQLSPSCSFINGSPGIGENRPSIAACPFRVAANADLLGANNVLYARNEVPGVEGPNVTASDPNYLLRTKQVVDMSHMKTYPKNPAMCSEEARLGTYQNWPGYAPVTPSELSNAGFYYTGTGDRVECFCCGEKLTSWEPGDRAWLEHKKHFPYCLFILGHDVGNVPLEAESTVSSPKHPDRARYEERIQTFTRWPYLVNPDELARAGFFSTGNNDNTICFSCGGGLKDWRREDDVWEQHAKWFPGCKYLVKMRGQNFVNHVQLRPSTIKCEHFLSFGHFSSNYKKDIHGLIISVLGSGEDPPPPKKKKIYSENPLLKGALQMGFSMDLVEKVINRKLQVTGENYPTLNALVSDLLKTQGEMHQEPVQEESEEKGRSYSLILRVSHIVPFYFLFQPPYRVGSSHTFLLSETYTSLFRSLVKLVSLPINTKYPIKQLTIMKASAALKAFSSDGRVSEGSLDLNKQSEKYSKQAQDHSRDLSVEEKLKRLREEKICKICMDKNVSIVFIPCGHLVACKECAEVLNKCPICCAFVVQKVRAYLS
uniref:E3 ubiquitin-protein ligase XIAP n=1 Tax=Latimeria chalumnae TaxID=7897 RepID=H3B9T4_LATCH